MRTEVIDPDVYSDLLCMSDNPMQDLFDPEPYYLAAYRSLNKDAPISRPVQQIGLIVSHTLVGGLYHQYVRI